MEYLIDDKILILVEKEYTLNIKKNICFFDSLNYSGIFDWRIIFNKMLDGFVYFKYIVDSKNMPKDYVLVGANDKYEELTGYKKIDVIGKKVTEIVGGKKDYAQELIKKFYKTAMNGIEQHFNLFSKFACKNYFVFVYSPLKNYFAIIFKEIPDSVDMQKKYRNNYKKITNILNLVCTSKAVIIELENPIKIENTKKLGIISSEVAKYLGLVDKNTTLKNSTLISGLNKIILPLNKKLSIKKLESEEVNKLSKYEDFQNITKKLNIYFMVSK